MKQKQIVATNRKIYHSFEIIEYYEAGIVLKGCEVKSLRGGKIDIKDAYCSIKNNEVWLMNAKIAEYEKSSHVKIPVDRPRKLLLKKREIKRLIGKMSQKGFILKPTKVYFNERGFAKIELALCKHKKIFDRREEIKERELKRELEFYKKYNYY